VNFRPKTASLNFLLSRTIGNPARETQEKPGFAADTVKAIMSNVCVHAPQSPQEKLACAIIWG
jgi:hypothetical protein